MAHVCAWATAIMAAAGRTSGTSVLVATARNVLELPGLHSLAVFGARTRDTSCSGLRLFHRPTRLHELGSSVAVARSRRVLRFACDHDSGAPIAQTKRCVCISLPCGVTAARTRSTRQRSDKLVRARAVAGRPVQIRLLRARRPHTESHKVLSGCAVPAAPGSSRLAELVPGDYCRAVRALLAD